LPQQQKNQWIRLSAARDRLCETFGIYFRVFVDEALANAIQSGAVPVRGVPMRGTQVLPVKIDGQQLAHEPRSIDIDNNRLFLKGNWPSWPGAIPDFQTVEIEWKALVALVRDLQPGKSPRPSDHDVDIGFRQSLARHREAQTRPSRSEHIAELRQQLPGMTENQYDSAKKQARESGILPADWSKAGRISNPLKTRHN
jgi:hypothetical protein